MDWLSMRPGLIVVIGLFVLVFLLMGMRPFNVIRLPMQSGGMGRKRLGLHWFFNLLALLFWGAAWLVYPSGPVRAGVVERSDLMVIPAVLLLLVGVVMVGIGLGRNWKRGPME